MKSKFVSLTAALATVLCSSASAEGFFIEGGAGYAVFNGGDYSLSSILPPDPAANQNTIATSLNEESFTVDDSSAAVFITGGYEVSDWLSLRVGYQHFGRTTTRRVSEVVIAGNAEVYGGSITTAYSDELQVVTFAPEFRWQATPRFALLFSPQLNWVFSDEIGRAHV